MKITIELSTGKKIELTAEEVTELRDGLLKMGRELPQLGDYWVPYRFGYIDPVWTSGTDTMMPGKIEILNEQSPIAQSEV